MTPDDLLDQIAADLAPRGATAGAMFGKRALNAHGKAFACLKGDLLAFRLGHGTPAHTEALALAGAELFDPSGKHRPFKDWVAIPASSARMRSRAASSAAVTMSAGRLKLANGVDGHRCGPLRRACDRSRCRRGRQTAMRRSSRSWPSRGSRWPPGVAKGKFRVRPPARRPRRSLAAKRAGTGRADRSRVPTTGRRLREHRPA